MPDEDLIDVHAHFLTDAYVRAARAAGHNSPDGMPTWPQWSVSEHLRLMDRHRIRMAVLSISSPGVHFGDDAEARRLARAVNDAGAAIVGEHPDRFGLFASLPLPDADGAVVELRRAFDDLGAAGVIVETNSAGHYLGDPILEPVYAELDRRGAVLFVHPTSPPASERVALGRPRPMLEFMFDSTRSITDLLLAGVTERYPNMRIVVPHAGAALPILSDRVELFRTVFGNGDGDVDWREALHRLWFDMAGTPFPTQVPVLTGLVGEDHLVYGSDYCWTPAAGVDAQVASVDAASLSAGGATWRELTTRNARRLLEDREEPV